MNDSKRKQLDALIVLVGSILMAEKQDLEDVPDNIEHSPAANTFRDSLQNLGAAILCLEEAKGDSL